MSFHSVSLMLLEFSFSVPTASPMVSYLSLGSFITCFSVSGFFPSKPPLVSGHTPEISSGSVVLILLLVQEFSVASVAPRVKSAGPHLGLCVPVPAALPAAFPITPRHSMPVTLEDVLSLNP